MTHYEEFVKFSNKVMDDILDEFHKNSEYIDGSKEASHKKMMDFDKIRKDMLVFLKNNYA